MANPDYPDYILAPPADPNAVLKMFIGFYIADAIALIFIICVIYYVIYIWIGRIKNYKKILKHANDPEITPMTITRMGGLYDPLLGALIGHAPDDDNTARNTAAVKNSIERKAIRGKLLEHEKIEPHF